MNEFRSNKQHFINSLFITGIFLFLPILFFLIESIFELDFSFLGVKPRELSSIYSVFTHIFVHGDLGHLANNMISLFILSLSLFYFYAKIADKVFLLSWFFTGLLLWTIGRDSIHIGASGLIYALAFFLFWSGVLRKYTPLVAIALIVVFFYGNMIWHVFPWQAFPTESWEGHLSGTLVGTVLAFVYRKQGPQRPIKNWNEESESEAEKDLANFAESFELEGEKKALNEELEIKNADLDEDKSHLSNGFRSSNLF